MRRMQRGASQAALVVVALMLAASRGGWAQCKDCPGPPAVDILGAHDNSGRGCAGCHSPHIVSCRPEVGAACGIVISALWEENAGPSSGQKVTFGTGGRVVQVAPNGLATPSSEISGILLCISCHDGNLTPQTMVASQSYEQKVGLLRIPGRQVFLTLAEDQQEGVLGLDHPLGVDATIEVGNGLQFFKGVFSVIPRTPYAQFVANYGWPTLAPGLRSNPYGIDAKGRPYVVCTTCHNQHAMNVYSSRSGSPIASDNGGHYYVTFFFVNGPYNPTIRNVGGRTATSNVQFCRQCHFHLANEANNTPNIPTVF